MSDSPAGKGDDPRPVDKAKWDKSWARWCAQGCSGPYRYGICIYCGGYEDGDGIEMQQEIGTDQVQ